MTTRTTRLFGVALAVALLVPSTALGGSSRPSIGTAPASVDLRAMPGATPFGDGFAIPLEAERPAWYTAELEARVLAAPGTPVPAPNDAPLPGTVGIRPGSWMISPSGCTMNFIFSKPGALGIGTAGHCVDYVGQPVVLLTLDPGASRTAVIVNIGSVAVRRDEGVGFDFALVAIKRTLWSWVSATTAVVGGPCGRAIPHRMETIWHYGHGTAIGTGGTPRAGVIGQGSWYGSYYLWTGSVIYGDSGSPVRVGSGLRAAGNLTHIWVTFGSPLPGTAAGTQIHQILRIAKGWGLRSSRLC